MKVNGKTVLVTGGGNGIGRELVLGLLRRGATVAALDVSEQALTETAGLAANAVTQLSTHVVDITDRQAVLTLAKQLPAVDGIVNNAGIIHRFARITDLDLEEIDRVLRVNLHGMINVTKAFLPGLLERPEAHIVNVSSMGGFFPFPGQTLYGASKAAVKIFTEGLALELAGTKVHATVVFPGGIGTDIAKNSGIALSQKMAQMQEKQKSGGGMAASLLTTPQQAAKAILDGMEKNKIRVFVGPDARTMDLLYRLSPKWSTALIHKLTGKLMLGDD